MTTYAYRNGILAYDEQGTGGSYTALRIDKAVQHNGMTAVICGDGGFGASYLEWVRKAGKKVFTTLPPASKWSLKPDDADIGAMIFYKGEAYAVDGVALPYKVRGEFFANGSGMPVALGAMAAGATAKEAVEIAAKYDVYTGGEIRTMEV